MVDGESRVGESFHLIAIETLISWTNRATVGIREIITEQG